MDQQDVPATTRALTEPAAGIASKNLASKNMVSGNMASEKTAAGAADHHAAP
jgi:hypothetical protein